jgi:hypothetical protein
MNNPSINGLEFEGVENHVDEPKNKNAPQEEAIGFSCKIIEAIDGKVLKHNENYPQNKITLNQLKEVFRKGSEDCSNKDNCMEVGMAKVNMFLRLVKGEKMKISNAPLSDEAVDISTSLTLSDNDMEQAKADIEKYNLDFNFTTSNDLFLETDPNFKWEL